MNDYSPPTAVADSINQRQAR